MVKQEGDCDWQYFKKKYFLLLQLLFKEKKKPADLINWAA